MVAISTRENQLLMEHGQNQIEWLNFMAKEEIDTTDNVKGYHKTASLSDCFKKLKERSLRLYRDATKALYGSGPYLIAPACDHLKCFYDDFPDLTKPEKENLIRRF